MSGFCFLVCCFVGEISRAMWDLIMLNMGLTKLFKCNFCTVPVAMQVIFAMSVCTSFATSAKDLQVHNMKTPFQDGLNLSE